VKRRVSRCKQHQQAAERLNYLKASLILAACVYIIAAIGGIV